MAGKKPVFFRIIKSIVSFKYPGRSWIAQPILAAIAMFVCVLISPVLAQAPLVNSTVHQFTISEGKTQDLVQQGKKLYEAGQFTLAVKVLQEASAAFRTQGDYLREAVTLSNLCLAFQQLSLWNQAEKAIAQSLNLLKSLKNSQESSNILAQALDVQGHLQLSRGQSEAALTTWQQAAGIYQQIKDTAAFTRNQINSAQALQVLGRYRQAKKILTEVSQTFQNQSDSSTKASGLLSLGNIMQVVGDLKESQQVLQQSLALAKATSSDQIIAETLFSLGNTARAQHDKKKALDYYQQAASASTDSTTRTQAHLNRLSLLAETKQFADASALSSQIESEINNLPASRMVVEAKINFAQSLMKLNSCTSCKTIPPRVGNPPRVAKVFSTKLNTDSPKFLVHFNGLGLLARNFSSGRATLLMENRATSPSSPTLLETSAQILASAVQMAQSLLDLRAESYALGTLGNLYQINQQFTDARKLTEKALVIAQNLHASDIVYQWQWQLGRIYKQQGNQKTAIAYYSEAFNTLQTLRSDLVAINPDIQFSFRESVEPVYRELVALLLQTENESVQHQENQKPENKKPENQKNLQQARVVMESLQIAELDNFFRSACLTAKQELDPIVDKKAPLSAVFYPIILPDRLDVILKLPNQNLRHYKTVVAKDKVEGVVENLREYLRDVTRTSQVKQLSQQIYDWLIQPAEAELSQSGIKTLVFVLDGALRNIPMSVLYDKQHEKYLVEKYAIAVAPGLQLLDPKPLQQVKLNTLVAGVAAERTIENRKFPPLENVPQELQQIQSEVPKTEELLNQKFTEHNLQKQLQSAPFSVVHLATHGEFSSDPEKTFVLTWDKLLKVKEFDNLLRVRDTKRSSTIELLVLSACKTAVGDKRAALGLAGVAVQAGARSTLATLWSVDDEYTANLMSQFYQELKAGVNKAEALRRAQLAVFTEEKSPYFWAPFVLVGNWL
ncbi:MAG: CHAT domain-containing protein [Brasilonema octagenarum HA4186-MV1]|jgi:CHAT domain-containing protein|nr:CHAT domain-containing protein [Brasilonema octagenarum HA4186-MV1]